MSSKHQQEARLAERHYAKSEMCDPIMKKAQEIDVKGTSVRIVKFGVEDYVCITDMAKSKSDDAQQTISNWMRNRVTIEYLGLREGLYNPDFKPPRIRGV